MEPNARQKNLLQEKTEALTLNVSEIFFSIQGESTYSGLPFIFVRLAGCNLRCTYCDTRYSYEEEGEEQTIDNILDEIKKFPCRNVEITGGEPLLQKNSLILMDALIKSGYRVLLETNGSVDISSVNQNVIKIMDIKCPGSNQEKSFDINNIKYMKKADEVKFVLSSRKDYDYAKKMIIDHDIGNKCNILMSNVYKSVTLKKIAQWVLEDGLDVRLQPQMHKYIFGDKRGV